MKQAIVAIDIGNTSMWAGVYVKGNKRPSCTRWATQDVLCQGKAFLKMIRTQVALEALMICSVVPSALRLFLPLCREYGIRPLVIGKDITVPLRNLYKKPEEVGQDRLVCAYEAYRRFKRSLLIIDYGTAVTFDMVSSKGAYQGGLIFPGIMTSYEALLKSAALLPRVPLKEPRSFIGTKTEEAMYSGIFYGMGALTDGLVAHYKKRFSEDLFVVATGGYASLLKRYTISFNIVIETLILDGIKSIIDLKFNKT